jgi:hypothetical protein
MTPELLTCPYCNAPVPAPEPARARILCPRCSETFPYHPVDTTATASGLPPTTPVPPAINGMPTSPRLLRASPTHFAVQIGLISALVVLASLVLRVAFPENETTRKAFPFMFLLGAIGAVASVWLWYFRQPRTNAATALFFVGNMVLVALVVLPFALLTRDFRRRNDPRPKSDLNASGPGKDGRPGKGRGPAELAALGYLPANSNLIVGVQVADLLHEPAGKEFLENSSWKPLEVAFRQVEKWTGLKKNAIDCIALGARTDELRLTVVIQTKTAYDPASFGVVLDERKPMKHHGRLLYPLILRPLGQGALWCVAERTLLLSFWWDPLAFPEMKATLPLKPRPVDEQFSPALRECLEKRVPREALVWIAGEGVPLPVVRAVLPFARSSAEKDKRLNAYFKEVRVFDASLRFVSAEKIALSGSVECPDETGAGLLQRALEDRAGALPGLGMVKVVGPVTRIREQALLGATLATLGGSSRSGETVAALGLLVAQQSSVPDRDAGHWVRFQLGARPGALNEALRSEGKLLPWLGNR